MKRAITFAGVLALNLGLAVPAAAQAGSVDRPIDEEPEVEVRYHKLTSLKFTEVDVKGRLKGPQGSYLRVRKKTRFRSLIELRGNFAPELERSAGAL
jgi:hypothetical protein